MCMRRFKRLPRIVTIEWVEQSWHEKTLLDEESMNVIGPSTSSRVAQMGANSCLGFAPT